MTLTKAKITELIQNELAIQEIDAVTNLETLLEIMKQTLERGDNILISGFGKFDVKKKRKRRGRNPATGEDMMLDERKVVVFRYSNKLKERVNGKT